MRARWGEDRRAQTMSGSPPPVNNLSNSDLEWQRSSYCSTNTCLEVAQRERQVIVRDSKDEDGPVLIFHQAEWEEFLEGARIGEFNLVPNNR